MQTFPSTSIRIPCIPAGSVVVSKGKVWGCGKPLFNIHARKEPCLKMEPLPLTFEHSEYPTRVQLKRNSTIVVFTTTPGNVYQTGINLTNDKEFVVNQKLTLPEESRTIVDIHMSDGETIVCDDIGQAWICADPFRYEPSEVEYPADRNSGFGKIVGASNIRTVSISDAHAVLLNHEGVPFSFFTGENMIDCSENNGFWWPMGRKPDMKRFGAMQGLPSGTVIIKAQASEEASYMLDITGEMYAAGFVGTDVDSEYHDPDGDEEISFKENHLCPWPFATSYIRDSATGKLNVEDFYISEGFSLGKKFNGDWFVWGLDSLSKYSSRIGVCTNRTWPQPQLKGCKLVFLGKDHALFALPEGHELLLTSKGEKRDSNVVGWGMNNESYCMSMIDYEKCSFVSVYSEWPDMARKSDDESDNSEADQFYRDEYGCSDDSEDSSEDAIVEPTKKHIPENLVLNKRALIPNFIYDPKIPVTKGEEVKESTNHKKRPLENLELQSSPKKCKTTLDTPEKSESIASCI